MMPTFHFYIASSAKLVKLILTKEIDMRYLFLIIVLLTGCADEDDEFVRDIYIDYTCEPYADSVYAAAAELNNAIGYDALKVNGFRGAYLPDVRNDGLNNIVCLNSDEYGYFDGRAPNVPAFETGDDIVMAMDRMEPYGGDLILHVIMHEMGHYVSGCGHIEGDGNVNMMSIGTDPDNPVMHFTVVDVDFLEDCINGD